MYAKTLTRNIRATGVTMHEIEVTWIATLTYDHHFGWEFDDVEEEEISIDAKGFTPDELRKVIGKKGYDSLMDYLSSDLRPEDFNV